MYTENPTVIDLFAGVGGTSLGAVRAGFSMPLAVELDKHALSAHTVNFPSSKHLGVDISQLCGEDLLNQAALKKGELSGLIGGPPCQGFSVMGHRNVTDPRNNLFVKFFELIKECQPKFYVVENVPGVLDKIYDEVRERAFKFIQNDYVMIEPIKLKASDFGAPTTRERVFFVGYRSNSLRNLTAYDFELAKVQTPVTVETALQGLPLDISSEWLKEEQSWREVQLMPTSTFADHIQGNIPDGMGNIDAIERFYNHHLVSGCFGTRHTQEVLTRYEQLRPGQTDRISRSMRLKLDGLCPTLRAGTGPDRGSYQAVRPIHPIAPRVITPREAARLQGFPDWFQFAPSKWHSFRQIGNSVSPILAESIFKIIYSHLYLH